MNRWLRFALAVPLGVCALVWSVAVLAVLPPWATVLALLGWGLLGVRLLRGRVGGGPSGVHRERAVDVV